MVIANGPESSLGRQHFYVFLGKKTYFLASLLFSFFPPERI